MSSRTPIRHDNGRVDKRYTIDSEYVGFKHMMHVVRFCGERIGSALTHWAAVRIAGAHQRARMAKLEGK